MGAKRAYLPETPEELTADWLSTALGGEVTAVSQTPLGDGQGFMGDILRLDLDSTDPALPGAVVAKLPKKSNRVMGELLGVYEREIMFFREFGEQVPIHVPRLYFSEFDRDKGSEKQEEILRAVDKLPRFLNRVISGLGTAIAASKKRRYLLLIEFFDHMQPGDQLAGLPVEACRQVLSAIAPLHRRYWQSAELADHFWLLALDVDARIRHGMFLQHADHYAGTLGPEVASQLRWIREHGEILMHRLVQEAPVTLLHCDLRLDNVVFDGDDCAFIDFQLVRRGPAAYDVAYFLSSALREDATDAEEQALLEHYHAALGVPDYGFDAFKRDYERAVLLVLAGLASAGDIDFSNERGARMMAAWLRRLQHRAAKIDPGRLI